MSAVDDLARMLKVKPQSGSDYTGKVTRVDGGTAYVRLTGSDIADTPVAMTIDAKPGDVVRVRVANGRAWITGNDTLPPTNDTERIETVRKTLTQRIQAVEESVGDGIAGNDNQYAWHTETGSDTGTHITRIPQKAFLDDPANGGSNLLARSNGIALRDGLTELVTVGVDGMDLYDSDEVRIAHFGANAMLGKATGSHITMTDDVFSVFNQSQVECFRVASSGSDAPIISTAVEENYFFDGTSFAYTTLPVTVTGTWDGAPSDSVLNSIKAELTLATRTNVIWYAEPCTLVPGTTMTVTKTVDGITYTASILYQSGTVTMTVSASGGSVTAFGDIDSHIYTYHDTAPAPTCQIGSLSAGGEVGAYSAGIGYDINPSGDYSAAIGQGVTAASDNQIAVGRYNDNDSGNIFEIGNGSSGSPSNAFAVDSNGAAAFGDPGGTFKITTHTVVNSSNIGAYNYSNGTTTITLDGYYPISIASWNSSNRYFVPNRAYLTNQTVGSGTLNWMVYNAHSSAHSASCSISVLWIKAT